MKCLYVGDSILLSGFFWEIPDIDYTFITQTPWVTALIVVCDKFDYKFVHNQRELLFPIESRLELFIVYSSKTRCALLMFKVRNNSAPKMDFRCMLRHPPFLVKLDILH